MPFSIRARMLVGFLAVILMTGSIAVVATVQLSRLGSTLQFLEDHEIPEVNTVWSIKNFLSGAESDIGHALLGHGIEGHLGQIRKRRRAIIDALADHQEHHLPMLVEEAEILADVLIRYEAFEEASDAITALVEQRQLKEARGLFDQSWYGIYESTVNSLNRLLDFELKEVAQMIASAETQGNSARNIIAVLAFAGVLLSIVFAVGITASVTKPIGELVQATERVARGDLNSKAEIIRNDEIGVLATRFNAMLDRQNETRSAQRRFYADASHELRTPLTVIQGEAEVALRGPDSVANHREALEHIVPVANQMGTLIDELLFLARVEADRDEYDMSSVALVLVLEEVAGRGERLASVKGVVLDIDLDTPAMVWGDPHRLRQMFASLVDNAIKYSNPGGTVTVALEPESDWAKVLVSDTGIGMSEDEQSQVFDRFFRGNTAKMMRKDGTGLGLSIVASVVEAHGGEILLESALGRGTTISVRLPRNSPGG